MKVRYILASLAVVAAGTFGTIHALTPSASTASTVTCNGTDVTTALQSAVNAGGTVSLTAGTCDISSPINVTVAGETIRGAGQHKTFIVETTRHNIFYLKADSITVEYLDLNSTCCDVLPPNGSMDTDPGVLYSIGNFTHIHNVSAQAGGGFGLRIVSSVPSAPCYAMANHGTVVNGFSITDFSLAGYAALDIDCTNGATISNITITGGILAIYKDSNVTLNGEVYHPSPYAKTCQQPPWFVTSSDTVANPAPPSVNISITNVTSYSRTGVTHGPVTNETITNQTSAGGCTN